MSCWMLPCLVCTVCTRWHLKTMCSSLYNFEAAWQLKHLRSSKITCHCKFYTVSQIFARVKSTWNQNQQRNQLCTLQAPPHRVRHTCTVLIQMLSCHLQRPKNEIVCSSIVNFEAAWQLRHLRSSRITCHCKFHIGSQIFARVKSTWNQNQQHNQLCTLQAPPH